MYYRINPDHTVSPTGTWVWQSIEERRVARTELPDQGIYVSTVFLCIAHAFGDDGPHVFESMAFPIGGAMIELACSRYRTWDEAVKGHEAMCQLVKDGDIVRRNEEDTDD